ncbi:hypothetical protein JXK06_02515 [Patescibacteria group bacterium]|nr:hypothetical protein [Patescibacteria group bacterium]
MSSQLFIIQSENNTLERISSFACLEDRIFQFQVKNISAMFCRGTDEEEYTANLDPLIALPGEKCGCHRFAV